MKRIAKTTEDKVKDNGVREPFWSVLGIAGDDEADKMLQPTNSQLDDLSAPFSIDISSHCVVKEKRGEDCMHRSLPCGWISKSAIS